MGVCECASETRCMACTYGTHYRLDGKCEECPSNPILVLVGCALAVVICLVGAYELDKREFNLAFLSIGVDYFQVLALFASADVRWPKALLMLFRAMSFFNMNVDVAAPECLVPEFKYTYKFYGTLALPLVCGVLLTLLGICKRFSDRFIMRRTHVDKYYTSALVGTFMLLMYYLYLMSTKRALEVFDCNPSEPDDGFLYTSFTDEECDGGLCRCGDTNHIQVDLVPAASLAILIYSCGFPVLVFILLRKNKKLVKEDQLLRALGTGDTASTNKMAFHVRRKYHKLYYHFKPGKWYWIVVILIRKAGVIFAGLMFRSNPGFQLSFVMLVLFAAYVFQVKHQPYMSTAQRKHVILEHREKAENGDQLHIMLAARIKSVMDEKKRPATHARKVTFGSAIQEAHDKKVKKRERSYFWDYNTVEQVLLACGIFVCLSGIMFESDRFQEDSPGNNKFLWQRDLIVYSVMGVVLFSFVFYFSVFSSEALGFTPKCVRRCFAKKHSRTLDKLIEMGTQDLDEFDDISLAMNPLQQQRMQQEAMRDVDEERKRTIELSRQLARGRAQVHLGSKSRKKGRRHGKSKKKTSSQRLASTDDEDASANPPVNADTVALSIPGSKAL